MSFARAKIKRFNEVTCCSPPVGSYTPKVDGTFPYPEKKSPPSRRSSRAGSVASLRSHGSNTRPSSRSSAGSSISEDSRTKCRPVSHPGSPKQLEKRAPTRTEGGKECKEIPPFDERFAGQGKAKSGKVSDVKVSDVKVSDAKVCDVRVCDVKINGVKVSEVKASDVKVSNSDALEVKSAAGQDIASTELINSLKNEISEKCISVEKLTLKVKELLTDNRRKADELEKLVKENESRREEMETVKLQLAKLRSENSKTLEELNRTKMVVKQLRQESKKETTELGNAKAVLKKISEGGSPTGIPEAKKSKLVRERLQNKNSRLTAQLQRSRVLLRLADVCENRRKSTENYSESKTRKQEEGRGSVNRPDVKSPTKTKFKRDLNLKIVQRSNDKVEESAKVQGTVAQDFKTAINATSYSVINAAVATKTEAERRQDFTKTDADETHLRRQSSCVSNADRVKKSPSIETPEDWKIELEELRKQLDDVDPCMEEKMETWLLERNSSIESRKEELSMDGLKFVQVEQCCGSSFEASPEKSITESSAVGRSLERDLTRLHPAERDLNRHRDKTRSENLGSGRTQLEIDSGDKRTGHKRNSTLVSQKATPVRAAFRRETKTEAKTFSAYTSNSIPRERMERTRNPSALSLSREFSREKVSAYNKRRVDQSPKSTADIGNVLSQATKTQSSEEIVRSYEDFLVRSGRGHRLGTSDLRSRGNAKGRPGVTKTDDDSEKSFQPKDPVKDLATMDDDDPDSPSRWKRRYEELWTTAQPFRDLLSAFSAQKQILSDRRRKTREDDGRLDKLCGEFSKLISHEHERRRMRQVVELKKQNSLLRIELDAIRRRRSAPPIIANRSGQQQQQPPQYS